MGSRAQSSGGAREHLLRRTGKKVHLHDGHQAGMKPDWRGVYRPRAASGTTAYSGAAGPHKRPSQDEAGGMLQCHTARTRQHRLPRKKGRPVFSGLAVLHDLRVSTSGNPGVDCLSVQPCSLASATFWGDQGRVLPV